ncbi:MAG: MerR family transcriptional regulator [Gammaproteobacteria bacterium]
MSRYPIGAAAQRSGVNIETIRYYEREGVVPSPDRSEAGRRMYDDQGIARLRFVKRCRELGFSIQDVKTLLALSTMTEPPCHDVKAIGERHILQVESKIYDLEKLLIALRGLIRQCDSGRERCPAIQKLFSD